MNSIYEVYKENYIVSTDKNRLDIDFIYDFLTNSSWARGISFAKIQKSIDNSLCFGLFKGNQQIGFARIVTDWATFGYLCDVFVTPDHQGLKLGGWLMECLQKHPLISTLRRVMLVTSSASWLYQKYGYTPIQQENFVFQCSRPDIYTHSLKESDPTA